MSRKADPPNKAKRFAKLVTEGKMNSALRYLSEEDCGGVLPLTEHVMRQLMDKHELKHKKLNLDLCSSDQLKLVPESLFQQINGKMVREAVLRT